ncbi:MAG: 4Fe-4S dicluster domain-containing protein [Clostridiales bacterium]|nr:4Fe-4S dicluster domain-containing protein [Clostridiales bacterium]
MEEVGLFEKCQVCRKIEHAVFDEVIGGDLFERVAQDDNERFDWVENIEELSSEEKFLYWQKQLSKCIRCNACRNTCPVCNCKKCVFSSTKFDMAAKVNTTDFEGQMFHAVRAFHVAERCTDCGECSRVCPQGIPLHLLNRKFIKEIKEKGDEIWTPPISP